MKNSGEVTEIKKRKDAMPRWWGTNEYPDPEPEVDKFHKLEICLHEKYRTRKFVKVFKIGPSSPVRFCEDCGEDIGHLDLVLLTK